MSQHDYDITTADANTGVTMRAEINAALQALAGNNSGATEPATKYPYMWWADTTSGYLKQRNAANSAWITVMLLATARMSNSDACDGFHASQTPGANQIPVLNSAGRFVLDGTDDGSSKIQTGGIIKAGGLKLSDTNEILWGDGSCKISGSGSTDIITATAATFRHNREMAIGSNNWFTINILSSGQVGHLWWGQINPSDTTKFIGTHSTTPAVRFYANHANDFFWAHAPNNGIGGELTFTNRMSFQADTGRLLLGPTLPTDNGVDALQVNGTIASTGCRVNTITAFTDNQTTYIVGAESKTIDFQISEGKTQSGYVSGIDSLVYINNANNRGTLSTQYGIRARAGINTTGVGGTITNVCGVFSDILNESVNGTITNAYGVYINNREPTGTITNRWGLYQVGPGTKNYFQGDVLIGTTTSDGVNKLQVNGTTVSTGYKLSALNTAPASASATGTLGEIRITADAVYICTATDTWKKVAIATW